MEDFSNENITLLTHSATPPPDIVVVFRSGQLINCVIMFLQKGAPS